MAPRVKKPKTLAQIRDEGTAFRRAAMPVAKGSGFDKLTEKNKAFSNGTTRVDQHNKNSGDRTPFCLPAVKKIHKAVSQYIAPCNLLSTKLTMNFQPTRLALIAKKKKLRLARKSRQLTIAPKPPIVESWRTASGAATRNEGAAVPTPFLEIARVPTWMEEKFKIALVDLLHSLGKELRVKEIAIDPQEAGGEFYSEISARFEDEVVAQQVLEKINGVLCHGRLLQVAFAPDALHEW